MDRSMWKCAWCGKDSKELTREEAIDAFEATLFELEECRKRYNDTSKFIDWKKYFSERKDDVDRSGF